MTKSRNPQRPEEDPKRENRIIMKIVVDAYGEDERALGWYYYLENQMRFPFVAVCDAEREMSPLETGERVTVVGLAGEDSCRSEVFVKIRYGSGTKTPAVPLMQLAPDNELADDDTRQAVEDWRYWVARGYGF